MNNPCFNVINCSSSTMKWHRRFGHIPINKLQLFSLVNKSDNSLIESCDICFKSKQHRHPFPKNISITDNAFDIVHVDIWGPYKHLFHDGFKYFLTIVNDHSRHTWVHMLSHKSYDVTLIKYFVTYAKNQFHKTAKIIRMDNAF